MLYVYIASEFIKVTSKHTKIVDKQHNGKLHFMPTGHYFFPPVHTTLTGGTSSNLLALMKNILASPLKVMRYSCCQKGNQMLVCISI